MQSIISLQDSQEGGSSATHHHLHHPLSPPTTTTTTKTTSTSTKRPFSPSSTSPSPNKSLKKSPTSQAFSKLTLPITFPSLSSSPTTTTGHLHRTLSEPISSFLPTTTPFSNFSSTSHNSASSAQFLKSQNQETAKNNFPTTSSNSLHKLLRSISDPTTLSVGVQSDETPSSKRLEKMKGIVKGISQLCDEVIYEDENENESEDVNNEDHNKNCSDSEIQDDGGEEQEAVSVEKKGDCLVLHFNCPCGLGYEILLSGKDCYYRLT